MKVSSRQHILCVFPTADDGQYIDWDGDSNIDARQHILRVFPTVHNGQYMIVDHVKVSSRKHILCVSHTADDGRFIEYLQCEHWC